MTDSAVILDCDGTLADSEPLSRRAWELALVPFGYAVTRADLAACLGRTYAHTHAYFAARASLPDLEAFWPLLTGELYPLLDRELRAFPDAVSAVEQLASRGIPMAVASSSSRERLERTLSRAGLADAVAITVAGDEVARGKPEPDMFLEAARRLGADPDRCIVVEDSPAGVTAGRRAGMVVVGVARSDEAAAQLHEADVVLGELTADALLAAERADRAVDRP